MRPGARVAEAAAGVRAHPNGGDDAGARLVAQVLDPGRHQPQARGTHRHRDPLVHALGVEHQREPGQPAVGAHEGVVSELQHGGLPGPRSGRRRPRPALVHPDDEVAVAHGAGVVRDDEGGAPAGEPVEGLEHPRAGGDVQAGDGLVEHHERARRAAWRGRWRPAAAGRRTASSRARRARCRSPPAAAPRTRGRWTAGPRARPPRRWRPGGRAGCSRAGSPRTARCPGGRRRPASAASAG